MAGVVSPVVHSAEVTTESLWHLNKPRAVLKSLRSQRGLVLARSWRDVIADDQFATFAGVTTHRHAAAVGSADTFAAGCVVRAVKPRTRDKVAILSVLLQALD